MPSSTTIGYSGAAQIFTVTSTGEYEITAYGAQGGTSSSASGGYGAEIGGDFFLSAGETLTIDVGGEGGAAYSSGPFGGGGGGGGGSFIIGPNGALLVAGGGGGGYHTRQSGTGGGGLTTTAGGTGYSGSKDGGGVGGAGGTGGLGGSGGNYQGYGRGGGGGGGYKGNGSNGSFYAYGEGGGGGGGGPSGSGGKASEYGGSGGFGGGGGGGDGGGGGGGGYSGGGGGLFGAAGAGGGSLDTGVQQTLVAAENANNGFVTIDAICYLRGTHIRTTAGEMPVERLTVGDRVATQLNNEIVFRPVKWIGRRRIDPTAHPRPETAMPVRIRRGAFADNVPHRDLLVSPDHAILCDGKLICARQLINGTTIRQEQGLTAVEYFHVELDRHAILFAEGLPAESYLDTRNRGFFSNSDQPLVLHPDLTGETDRPMREAASCAPFVWDETNVRPVWERLAERATILGLATTPVRTTTDPNLCVVAKGRTLCPIHGDDGRYHFVLPKGETEVRLISRAASPTDVLPWLEDRRRLGVYVERITVRSSNDVREIPVDHPGLTQGWWAVEGSGMTLRRWTTGDAVLPLPVMAGPVMLEVRASNGGMAYLVSGEVPNSATEAAAYNFSAGAERAVA
jgi:hypothetical protein